MGMQSGMHRDLYNYDFELKKDVFLDLCGFDGVGGAPMLANLVYN